MNQKYRKVVIAGNWKMNKLPTEVRDYVKRLRELLPPKKSLDVVICAPFVSLSNLCKTDRCQNSSLRAGRICSRKGAYTGEVSPKCLRTSALDIALSDTRREESITMSDNEVNGKVKRLLDAGIIPIICVGESLEQRESDITKEHLAYQIKAALSGLSEKEVRKCVIAYEPIWAIGTGKTASAEMAGEMCKFIRTCIKPSMQERHAR